MDYTVDNILKIPEETEFIEFKRILGEKKVVSKIVQTIVAFANTDGGRIIIGVDDPEKTDKKGLERIYGIEESKENYDEIFRELQRVVPAISTSTEVLTMQDVAKTIAIIEVPKAINDLHTIDNSAYIRLKKGNRQITLQEYADLRYARGFSKSDEELIKDVDFGLLNTAYYREWCRNRGISDRHIKQTLFNTGLARKEEGEIFPTRAAVMLFAEHPTMLMETKCAIKIMKYTDKTERYGKVPNMIGVPKIIDAPTIELIRKAHEYVMNMLSAGIEIHSGFLTRYLIPERAIKEAITNAVIHRDYNIKRDIEIKLFEDRVEIISPGLLPYNININNIGRVRAVKYRNDLLVKTLREFPSPPNLDQNEGVIAMQNEMKAEGLYPPVFKTYPELIDVVDVVLFNEHTPTEWEKVKAYLENNNYINNHQARDLTGVEQMHKMSKLFNRWVKQGLLIKIMPGGSAKNTLYKLAKDNNNPK